jgi:hypothetical protein
MLRLTGTALAAATLAMASLALAVTAQASYSPPRCDDLQLTCEQSTPLPPVGGHSGSAGGTTRICTSEGETIPCSTSDGIWDDRSECYLKPVDGPGPPPAGKKTGGWYKCTWDPRTTAGVTGETFWLDQPPAQLDPAQLAREILARIQLQRVGIGITPEPGNTGILGLPTYLWVNNPGPRTLGPITDSATEGGVTVTLTARVSRVVWSLGDGTTITCAGAGTPYRDEFGARPSPTCGHTYKHPSTHLPGGVYRVTATAVWDVAWTGGGQSGQIPFEVASGTSIRIGEVQALT